ncbi:SDR family NAD(P)-dependent oxidoreductase [Streptomyces iconiensis]|uniref:Glucose 1-dehydrogenase n=1 Tax=Streptomyces iconiensis TaxID=1384038 RepID=A0ABT7A9R7_9ACTN|nr:glucose 1-dehydrogenase [Streptomyces iconiensis]MDJ1138108.1 glucose 1-dehydrogenase [Streptomyces iconiensis]
MTEPLAPSNANPLDLTGKVALVTGAAQGQGAEHARTLAAAGASVVLTDIQDADGEALAAEVCAANDRAGGRAGGRADAALFLRHDVSSAADWERVVAAAVERYGRLDILVNNAALWHTAPVGEETEDRFRTLLSVNLVGPFLGIRAVLPAMRAAGGGSVINISSTAGLTGIPGHSAYGATKFGLRGMTKSAALDVAADGIRINSVHPGMIDTPMIAGVTGGGEDVRDRAYPNVPMRRIGTPDDVARLVLFLASDASSYVTGAEFAVDGGLAAR